MQRSWDGTQKAHLYNQLSGVHMLLYIFGLLGKALLRSKKCTACRTSPSRRTGSWIETPPVRIITAAPEFTGVLDALPEFDQRGVVFSIGHRYVESPPPNLYSLAEGIPTSIGRSATSDLATEAVRRGARLITHLFNAMHQLHHRDPSIIGLLGASPHISPPPSPAASSPISRASRLQYPRPVSRWVKCRCTRKRSRRVRRSTTTRRRPRLPCWLRRASRAGYRGSGCTLTRDKWRT